MSTREIYALSLELLINSNKTLSMVILHRLNPVQHPPLFTNDTIFAETTRHWHLGLTFSSTCTWTEHVNNISGKAWTRQSLLRLFNFRVTRKSLENYISHSCDHYLNIVILFVATAHQNRQETVRLEAMLTRASRTVSGAIILCSIFKTYSVHQQYVDGMLF